MNIDLEGMILDRNSPEEVIQVAARGARQVRQNNRLLRRHLPTRLAATRGSAGSSEKEDELSVGGQNSTSTVNGVDSSDNASSSSSGLGPEVGDFKGKSGGCDEQANLEELKEPAEGLEEDSAGERVEEAAGEREEAEGRSLGREPEESLTSCEALIVRIHQAGRRRKRSALNQLALGESRGEFDVGCLDSMGISDLDPCIASKDLLLSSMGAEIPFRQDPSRQLLTSAPGSLIASGRLDSANPELRDYMEMGNKCGKCQNHEIETSKKGKSHERGDVRIIIARVFAPSSRAFIATFTLPLGIRARVELRASACVM